MTEEGQGFSFTDLRSFSSWIDKLMYCKYLSELNPNHKNATQIIGSFKVTTIFPKTLTRCRYFVELPEIISYYLRLNLTFVKPNNDFDGSLGLYNGTHSSGPLKMFSENQIDYIINDIYITENIWNPNLYQMSTALFNGNTINFIVRKQVIKTSISDYFKTFNLSNWILIICCIILLSVTQSFISRFKFDKLFCVKLSWDYLLLLIGKSSELLSKLIPRHYLMYFIPLLSIFLIGMFQNMICTNMIIPRKHWCQDIDCFAKSKIGFHAASDEIALIVIKQKKESQFKEIMSKVTTIKQKGKFILDKLLTY